MTGLAGQLKPCGPVLDSELAARTREPVEAAAREGGWLETLDTAWPALEPVFAAAPIWPGWRGGGRSACARSWRRRRTTASPPSSGRPTP